MPMSLNLHLKNRETMKKRVEISLEKILNLKRYQSPVPALCWSCQPDHMDKSAGHKGAEEVVVPMLQRWHEW